jgi:hypothetical protein
MKRSADRFAEATLANQRIPRARLDDSEAVAALSTAITLRAARPGSGQVNEEFVARLRRLLAEERAEVPRACRRRRDDEIGLGRRLV